MDLHTEDQRLSLGKVQDSEDFGGDSIWFQGKMLKNIQWT